MTPYNQRLRQEIERRFGEGVLEQAEAEARRIQQQPAPAPPQGE